MKKRTHHGDAAIHVTETTIITGKMTIFVRKMNIIVAKIEQEAKMMKVTVSLLTDLHQHHE